MGTLENQSRSTLRITEIQEPKISFISSLFNCMDLTRAMLESLESTVDLSSSEILLVDDASTDNTPEFLKTLDAPFRVITNSRNSGFAISNNRAAVEARGNLLVFLNNDLALSKGWLEPMLSLLEKGDDVGLVGNIQLNYQTGLIDHAGIFFDLDGMPTHAQKNRRRLPKGNFKERNAVTAACIAMRRKRFLEVNGFDESYRNGMEDVDLCMKLREKGYRLYVSHKSIVRHHISKAPGRHEQNDENSRIFRQKWADFAKSYGRREWPIEYFRRYARFWWRMEPKLACLALILLLRGRKS